MYKIIMDVLCLGGYSEILPDDVENTELVIEDLIALILLDLFGIVMVEGVHVTCLLVTPARQPLCTLQVQATCPTEATGAPGDSLEMLEARLENAICCALIELFSTVLINKIVVHYEPCATPETAVLSLSA